MNKAQAIQIGGILGKCTVKNLGTLFLPLIQLKAAINKMWEEFETTQKQIIADAGVEVNPIDGSVPEGTEKQTIIQINETVAELSRQSFDYSYQILSNEDLIKLAEENPSLTISETTALLELIAE